MKSTDKLLYRTIDYFEGMPKRIQHLLKVRDFALLIGQDEKLDPYTLEILEAVGIVHDVGVKPAAALYGHSTARLQEELGPDEARKLLIGWPEDMVERICYLIAHHHTYDDIQGADYQILVEADFLVNFFEHDNNEKTIRYTLDTIFRTDKGKQLCRTSFGLDKQKPA